MQRLEQNFDSWNSLKKEIHFKKPRPYFKIREVWWTSVGQNIGDEEYGKNSNFERPVLIIARFYGNLALVIPISSKIKEGSYYYQKVVNNKNGSLILSQIRVIDSKRLIRKIETISISDFSEIVSKFKNLI